MKTIDLIFGWIMVILGVVHTFFTFRSHGFSSFAAYYVVIIIALAGLINVSRAKAPKGLIKFTSAFANIVVVASTGVLAYSLHSVLRENLQVPVLLVVAVIELVFSIWG